MGKVTHKTVVKCDENGAIDLADMLKGTNTSPDEVEYYHLEKDGESLKVTLFDKDKKQIIVKEK